MKKEKKLLTKICKICGEEFTTYARDKKYCSLPCKNKARYKMSNARRKEQRRKEKEERSSMSFEEKMVARVKNNINITNCLCVLKRYNILDKVCEKSRIPKQYLFKYGVNDFQFERILKNITF